MARGMERSLGVLDGLCLIVFLFFHVVYVSACLFVFFAFILLLLL